MQIPSNGTFKVVQAAEAAFRLLIPSDVSVLPTIRFLDLRLEHLVLKSLSPEVAFPNLCTTHFFDHELLCEEDHVTKLMRLICNYYARVRLFKYGKQYYHKHIFSSSILSRQQSTKLVLFRGQ